MRGHLTGPEHGNNRQANIATGFADKQGVDRRYGAGSLMFSARAYSFRQKARLAISLSWVAGYANVVAFTACGGVFVSHVTGTATMLGQAFVERRLEGVFLFGGLWLSFFMGAAMSALMTESARRRGSASKYVLPLAVEALLLSAVAIGMEHFAKLSAAGLAPRSVAFLAAFAMGIQNATITKISGAVVRTTHLTGVTTDLGLEGMQYVLWVRDRLAGRGWPRVARMIRVSRRHPDLLRVLLLASIFGSFLFGAGAGMFLFLHWGGAALALPVAFLLWMIYVDWSQPIADVREIDLFGDHELKLHGIVKTLLPAELGIWRVFCKRHGRIHRAPDFEQWVDRMPSHWRVIILSLSPLLRFDSNALLNLEASARKLAQQDRRLVLAGVTPAQYRSVQSSTAGDVIDCENLCPDLEFAIARGIELVREGTQAPPAWPAPA